MAESPDSPDDESFCQANLRYRADRLVGLRRNDEVATAKVVHEY